VAVIATAGALLAGRTDEAGRHPRPASSQVTSRPARPRQAVAIAPGAGVAALAVAGNRLYLATDFAGNPPYDLAAYDRRTGRLIRRVSVPALPMTLVTGQGGNVWLTFSPDQGGGPAGTWLLSPDLARRSATRLIAAAGLFPVSTDTAIATSQYGLMIVQLPAPGAAGTAVVRRDPGTAIDGRFAVGALARAGNRFTVQVTDGAGEHSHLVIAGHPGTSYSGGRSSQAGAPASEDGGLWAVTFAAGAQAGPLVRLSPNLTVTTPAEISASPVLHRSEQVWAYGHTVWVATASGRHQLVCFRYDGTAGPLQSLPVRRQPVALAMTARTLYVSLATSEVGVSSGVLAYPVPAACR
jgi:hypothetical protein